MENDEENHNTENDSKDVPIKVLTPVNFFQKWSKSIFVVVVLGVLFVATYFCLLVYITQSSSTTDVTSSTDRNMLSPFPRSNSPTSSTTPTPTSSNTRSASNTRSPPPNFLLLTDLHVDPLYSPTASISDYCREQLGPEVTEEDGEYIKK